MTSWGEGGERNPSGWLAYEVDWGFSKACFQLSAGDRSQTVSDQERWKTSEDSLAPTLWSGFIIQGNRGLLRCGARHQMLF